MRSLIALYVVVGGLVPFLLSGQDLDLPASNCALKVAAVEERIETQVLNRLEFDGCIRFRSNPLPGFMRNPDPVASCGLEMEHIHDPGTRMQFWIYDNNGTTRFDGAVWNNLISKILETYPEQIYRTRFDPLFEDDREAGSPVLGHVPLMGSVSIFVRKDEIQYRNHLCVVPTDRNSKVLVVCLRTSEKHEAYMLRLFRAFLTSLYAVSGES